MELLGPRLTKALRLEANNEVWDSLLSHSSPARIVSLIVTSDGSMRVTETSEKPDRIKKAVFPAK